jgi:hypothetical protein
MRISLAEVIRPILIKGPAGMPSAGDTIASGNGDFSVPAGFDGAAGDCFFADSAFFAGDAEEGGGRGDFILVWRPPQAAEKANRIAKRYNPFDFKLPDL